MNKYMTGSNGSIDEVGSKCQKWQLNLTRTIHIMPGSTP